MPVVLEPAPNVWRFVGPRPYAKALLVPDRDWRQRVDVPGRRIVPYGEERLDVGRYRSAARIVHPVACVVPLVEIVVEHQVGAYVNVVRSIPVPDRAEVIARGPRVAVEPKQECRRFADRVAGEKDLRRFFQSFETILIRERHEPARLDLVHRAAAQHLRPSRVRLVILVQPRPEGRGMAYQRPAREAGDVDRHVVSPQVGAQQQATPVAQRQVGPESELVFLPCNRKVRNVKGRIGSFEVERRRLVFELVVREDMGAILDDRAAVRAADLLVLVRQHFLRHEVGRVELIVAEIPVH